MASPFEELDPSDDFSIIVPNQNQLSVDFSLQSLLSDNPPQQLPCQNMIESQVQIFPGSFLKDLKKLQKQVSFDQNPYNIYEPSGCCLVELGGTIESKHQSTSTKALQNNISKSTRFYSKKPGTEFNHLIVDFDSARRSRKIEQQKMKEYNNFRVVDRSKSHQNSILKTGSIFHPKNDLGRKTAKLRSPSKSLLKSKSLSKNKNSCTSRKKETLKIKRKSPLKRQKGKSKGKKLKKKKDDKQAVRRQRDQDWLRQQVMEEYFGYKPQEKKQQVEKQKRSQTKKKKKVRKVSKKKNIQQS